MTADGTQVPSAVSQVLRELNLPHLIAGHAGQALSRLIGAAVEVPAAAIENVAERIKDDRRARTQITDAVAMQAAQLAAADPELVQRSLYRWLGENAKKQAAREAIAKKAAVELGNDLGDDASPDDDWMNVFVQHAENATTERMQLLWSKVLTGEIRKSGSFSLSALRFMAELDAQTAEEFIEILSLALGNDFIPKPEKFRGAIFSKCLRLQERGLLSGVEGSIVKIVELNDVGRGHLMFVEAGIAVEFFGAPGQKIEVGSVLLTGVGKEIASIVRTANLVEDARRIAPDLRPKDHLTQIVLHSGIIERRQEGTTFRQSEIIWKAE